MTQGEAARPDDEKTILVIIEEGPNSCEPPKWITPEHLLLYKRVAGVHGIKVHVLDPGPTVEPQRVEPEPAQLTPNRDIPIDQVVVGNASDARWRDWPEDVLTFSALLHGGEQVVRA